MIPKELLKKIRRIEIYTNRMVNEVIAGQYQSVFKGRGMEFDEVREYRPGDDIRTIDWNVTARMGSPYVKKYVEERELTVMLLVDVSSSGSFGSFNQMKGELAAEICALLAFSAIKNNDRVGLLAFTDQVEKYIPPKSGSEHVLQIVREILYFKPKRTETDIAGALDYLNRIQTKKAVVFLVSDFLSGEYEKPLRIANKKHDVIAISVSDPREISLPPIGILELEDAETGDILVVDTYDSQLLDQFSATSEENRNSRTEMFKKMGIDHIEIFTDKPYLKPLVLFFRERARRLRAL